MYFTEQCDPTVAIIPISRAHLSNFLTDKPDRWKNWVKQNEFNASAQSYCLLPNASGQLDTVLLGMDDNDNKTWLLGDLPKKLPAASYVLTIDENASAAWSQQDQINALIGWGLGAYSFDEYKHQDNTQATQTAQLYVPQAWLARVTSFTNAFYLVRDLINTPANHMMPEQLSYITAKLAREFGASFMEISGELLLDENYPLIHAVGRASEHPPRFLELTWGDETTPRLTLVGKGVCFDTGGLDLKPSKFMRLMKKDMGGAAHVLGLASLIMQNHLPVHLRVLIPAVDNAVSGNAFRPGDVIPSRSGKTVEIDNTDAEGRLVLCDALTDAVSDDPDLVIDFATLTGAARVALGTEIPVFFTNQVTLAEQLTVSANQTQELVWQLPLYAAYRQQLNSDCADLLNSSPTGYGGAITAALFLQNFIPESIAWLHFDVMAWNNRARAGRPKGGEAMGLFTVYHYLEQRYAVK
ncbi:MAG: leucyl aminopeptidase family protein [bacterium]